MARKEKGIITVMNIEYIGWCHRCGHDKVWGIAHYGRGKDLNTNLYASFWGRRGKKLQKKLVDLTPDALYNLILSKKRKGYIEIAKNNVNEVYDNFSKDIFKVALSVK